MEKNKSLLEKIPLALNSFEPRILFAYIFGSTGTHLEDERSDLDIAVYFDLPASQVQLDHKLFLYAHLSRASKRNDLDIVILNTCSNLILLFDILTDGRLIFDIDPDNRMLFEQKKLHLAIDFKEQRERIMG